MSRILLGAERGRKWGYGFCPSGTDRVGIEDPDIMWQDKVETTAKSQLLDLFSLGPVARWDGRKLAWWDLIIKARDAQVQAVWLWKARAWELSGALARVKDTDKIILTVSSNMDELHKDLQM
jgi:hypothetical protein